MSQNSRKLPKYRLHKSTGQAFVELGGRYIYLGKHGTKTSRIQYDQVIAEWLAQGRPKHFPDVDNQENVTAAEVCLEF